LGFVDSHPFHKEHEMDGAPKLVVLENPFSPHVF